MRTRQIIRRDNQVNVRFTDAELVALDAVAEYEEHSRSYVVNWLTRWAIEQYKRAGSLVALRSTKINTSVQSVIETDIDALAEQRLKLMKEAQDELQREAAVRVATSKIRHKA